VAFPDKQTCNAGKRRAICVVTTTPLIVNFFLRGNLAALASRYDLTLILNLDEPYKPNLRGIDLRVISVRIERKISLFRDLAALARLVGIFMSHDFRVVHSVAPKAGLLAMIAAWIARVPTRIHTFQGETWAARSGFMRSLLKIADRIVAHLATHLLVVSRSEQEFLIEQGILAPARSRVLASGSISGVDVARFRADPEARRRIRRDFDIGDTDVLFLFLGRIARDKGILDLAAAFASVAAEFPHVRLLVVGPDEDGIQQQVIARAGAAVAKLRFSGITDTPEQVLAAADVICLPSYREAFGMVILEAAAMRIPAVASRIYGITDAVIEGETGLLHEASNPRELASQMKKLAENPELRRALGEAAYARVHREFRSERVIEELLKFYDGATSDETRATASP
jgi:glycosyltransferase involved in cell wall biosynthesis